MAKERLSELEKLMEKHGAITGIELEEFEKTLPILSTGIFPVDLALGTMCPETGCGGIRARDLIEVMGQPGSGKTAFAASMIRTTQARYPGKGSVVCLFTEPPDVNRMRREGIKVEDLIILGCYAGNRVKDAAQLLDAVVEFASKAFCKLVVIDSVAMLFTEAEREKDVSDNQNVAGLARIFNPFIKKYLDNVIHAPLLYLNHWREAIQITFKGVQPSMLNPHTPGGQTKDFMSRVRIIAKSDPLWRMNGSEKVIHSETGRPIMEGLRITYTLIRNKYMNKDGNRPVAVKLFFSDSRFNTEELTLNYAEYFCVPGEDGKPKSILTPQMVRNGAWYQIGDKKFNGTNKAIEYLRENQDLLRKVQAQIMPRSQEFFADSKEFSVESVLETP